MPRYHKGEEWLTVEELARALKVKPSWVYEAVRLGRIPYAKTGKYLRFQMVEVAEALEVKVGGSRPD